MHCESRQHTIPPQLFGVQSISQLAPPLHVTEEQLETAVHSRSEVAPARTVLSTLPGHVAGPAQLILQVAAAPTQAAREAQELAPRQSTEQLSAEHATELQEPCPRQLRSHRAPPHTTLLAQLLSPLHSMS